MDTETLTTPAGKAPTGTGDRHEPDQRAEVIVSTDKLSKSFSLDGAQQHVLKNLDLDIVRGDFTVIMGRSGAGKSTLLHALSGMDSPSLGSVIFDGTDISAMSQDKLATFRRSHCGFVFQQINLLDSITLADNVLVPGLLGRAKRSDVVARANELFDLVGLDEVTRKKFPVVVSGGEAQRAAIVRALINEPDVLFADEPTGQLDSANSTLLLDLLTTINRGGQSIVMVTHDTRSALRGNRIIYLLDGTIHGQLTLGPYTDDAEQRSATLSAFLDEMGWRL
ncbi:MAG: ABC transporter ATP-binding protein [Actinomycetaceae bacterium]|nr:ABC transporter ATP-binding protein [Actinomycetaceae bacterium]